MYTTATHINYLHICRRKLWLFSHGMTMEHTSDIVTEGKLIGEESYPQRSDKYSEVAFDGVKIDFYDAKNKVVHETKKGNQVERAHEAQVKYYLYKLLQNGIEGAMGIIEYPTLRHTTHVAALTDDDVKEIVVWEQEIMQIIDNEQVPKVINSKICKKCSYQEFCYAD